MPDRSPEDKRDFLNTALEQFKEAAEAEDKWRRASLEDWNFYLGDQWASDTRERRKRQRKPCLTINRLPQFKRLVVNEYRQQRPAIQISPVGDGADVETAKDWQGMIRSTEVNCDAEVAYDTAFDGMVIGGFQYLIVRNVYSDEDSFNQDAIIECPESPFMVYSDPERDLLKKAGSDARYRFIITDYTKAAFKRKYPRSEAASLTDYSSVGDDAKEWLNKETVRVAEYFYIEDADEELSEGEKKRTVSKPKVKWAKITAVDILAETSVPCRWIPIADLVGEHYLINGKRTIKGLVRDGIDAQRAYNVWKSEATHMIALAPKAPWKIADKAWENYEEIWKTSNIEDHAALPYHAHDDQGRELPEPQRNSVEPPIQAMTVMLQGAAQDLQSTIGINDANLGQRKPDESGKAVLARQKQGDITTLHYSDNAARTMRQVGRILLDMLPRLKDVAQVQRILDPDGTARHIVTHSGEEQQGDAQGLTTEKITRMLDLKVGKYDVTVSVGPSYQTKRQEAVASIMALIQAAPQVLTLVGDLLVGNMDWNNAPEIAKRLKMMVLQQFPMLAEEEGNDPEVRAQQAQAKLAALEQVHQQVMEAFQQASQIITQKLIENRAKVATNAKDNETKIAVAEITTKAQDAMRRAQIELDLWKELHGAAHDTALASQQQGHESDMADRNAQIAANSQQSDQSHESGMADKNAAIAQNAATHQAALEPQETAAQ